MKISIIIATYNAGQFLERCLQSCIAQTWEDKEIIVVDGASKDSTVDIIRKFSDSIAFWVSEPDRGIYDAWNKALKHATGDWVLFRGADDVFWDDAALENMAPYLVSAEPRQLLVYGTVVVVDADEHIRHINGRPWDAVQNAFFQEMTLPHPGVFHHIALFEQFGNFDITLRLSSDYDYLLRVLKHGGGATLFAPGVIVTKMYDVGGSARRIIRSRYEAILARRRNAVRGVSWVLYGRILSNCFYLFARWAARSILGEKGAAAFYSGRHKNRSEALAARIPVTGRANS